MKTIVIFKLKRAQNIVSGVTGYLKITKTMIECKKSMMIFLVIF